MNVRLFGLLFLPLAACDYSGDWLFANRSEVPGVLDLGVLVPADVAIGGAADAVVFGEVGATGTAESGGVTFSFRGTGGPVCVWVDPELVSWNQSIALIGPTHEFTYPDNNFDDGDFDIFAGFSVYYTGTPAEHVGSFAIQYDDSLGNGVPIQLNECTIAGMNATDGAHAGRGAPESCTLQATQPGVSYTVLMETFSTPLDDDRLGFGLILANGSCRDMQDDGAFAVPDECVILGEANDIAGTIIGEDASIAVGDPIAGSEAFEKSFCHSLDDRYFPEVLPLPDYCVEEATAKNCLVETCFCGDPSVSPTAELQ